MKKIVSQILPLAYGAYYNLLVPFAPQKTAHKAFELFCTVRGGRVKPQQADYLDMARDTLIQVADHHIQTYRWPGEGPTVLLVHGWESNAFRWRNLISKLREAKFNVIAFDAPAHGHSTGKLLHVPLYTQVLQHIIKTCAPQYVVAHSVGGMTLLYNDYKYQNPEIEKMVTVAAPSEFHEIMSHYQKLLRFNNKVYGALDTYIKNKFGFTIQEFSTSKFAKTNTKKGFLLHDRKDAITPCHASEQVHKNWKDSTFMAAEGQGHSMHQDEINDRIIEFLNA
ncbi:MAG: alpha/beta fold hydrolase [Flavobacteriaceae bacterium]